MAETLVVGQSINYWLLDCKRKVEMQNPSLRLQADKRWGYQMKEIENQIPRMGIRGQRHVTQGVKYKTVESGGGGTISGVFICLAFEEN